MFTDEKCCINFVEIKKLNKKKQKKKQEEMLS